MQRAIRRSIGLRFPIDVRCSAPGWRVGRGGGWTFAGTVARNARRRRLRDVKALGGDRLNEKPSGAEQEFTRFYREAYPSAVRLAWLLTHDHGAAEDIVQDAFVRLHPRLATVEHPTAYLRAAIVNGCRDRARSAGRAGAGLRRLQLNSEMSAADRPCELLDAVARLPYKHRAVLALRYWADLPEAEIAEIIGVRPATVRSISVRAIARLRKELPE